MPKLQFLCAHHRHWLSEKPSAASFKWMRAYSADLKLTEEYNYLHARRHAGAAFETAELLLGQQIATSKKNSPFSDSGALLIQVLYRLNEARLASALNGSSRKATWYALKDSVRSGRN